MYTIVLMNNLIGLGLSYIFVLAVLAGAALLQNIFHLSAQVTRKLIHISVSNWWFILMMWFDSLAFALIGPVSFILLNFISYRFHLLSAMELEDNRSNLGTIYFPISLLVLVILSYTDVIPIYAGAVGILIMGYGDGFASLFGGRFGRIGIYTWGGTKSVVGTLVMFVASALVTLLVTLWFHPYGQDPSMLLLVVLVVAVVATVTELITPWGADNLTVPIMSALVYAGLV